MTPKYPHKPPVLEDFSQNRINRGQQQINYMVKEIDEKIVDALRALSYAVAKLGGDKVDYGDVDRAIDAVAAATAQIAGEFPPGCTDPS